MMQIPGEGVKMPGIGIVNLIERECEQILIIRLKFKMSVCRQNLIVAVQKLMRGQTTLRVSVFRPRIGKIQIDSVDFAQSKDIRRRVDFRELLKDLAAEFRVRIELRQVGPREGAKFIGGIGPCGRVICCKSHLREFDLVTMKMAKDQGMTLSASKVAGLCGKLMCCIGYESAVYDEVRKRIPLVGDIVDTPKCKNCRVISVDFLKERLRTIDREEKIDEWEAKEVVKIQAHKEEVSAKDLTDDIIDE